MAMNGRLSSLMFGDSILAVLATGVGYFLRYGVWPPVTEYTGIGMIRLIVFVTVFLFLSFLLEVYGDGHFGEKERYLRMIGALLLTFMALSALYYLLPVLMFGRSTLLLSMGFLGIAQVLWHWWYRAALNFPGFTKKVLVVGTGPLALRIGEVIAATDGSYVLSGYVNCTEDPLTVPVDTVVGNGDGLFEAVKREKPSKIVVSLSERRGVFPLQEMLTCKLCGIDVTDAPSFYEQVTGKLMIEDITPSWFIFSHGFKVTPALRLLKRMFDILLSVTGILLVLPILPLIAAAIKIDSRGPVLFRQVRMGEGERLFALYKFRTMREDAEAGTGAVWATKDDPRVTRLGRFLRKSRLDEIPQLFNVLSGSMSFVGPRPERPEFIEELKQIIPYYSERHYMKPGVTGWAQVRYPYGASVEDAVEKLRYDLYYIKNVSVFFDFLIILETIKVVLFQRGGR